MGGEAGRGRGKGAEGGGDRRIGEAPTFQHLLWSLQNSRVRL